MKTAIVITAVLAGVVSMNQSAVAQPPGGGGPGGFAPPVFADIDKDDDGKIMPEELATYFQSRAAGAPGGAGPGGGAGGPPGGGAGGPGGAFDPTAIFGRWDANSDGEVTEAEYDARPRGGQGGGAPGAGGPPRQ